MKIRTNFRGDSLEEQGVFVERDALAPLLANMQTLSNAWQDSI